MNVSDPTVALFAFLRGEGRLEDCQKPCWPLSVAIAAKERVLPPLGAQLIALGAEAPPPEVADHLLKSSAELSAADLAIVVFLANSQRNADLLSQMVLIRRTCEILKIVVLPLKGIAMLERYENYHRELTDIDLLVGDPERASELSSSLIALGYREATEREYRQSTLFPDDHQLVPLLLDGRSGSVELHRRVLQEEYDSLLPVRALHGEVANSDLTESSPSGPRMTVYAMCLHSIIHSRIVDNSYRRHELALRSVLDVARLLTEDPTVVEKLQRDARSGSRIFRRSISAHLFLASLLASGGPTVTPSFVIRCWWYRTRFLQRRPRLHEHFQSLALIGFSLQQERMEQRAGRRLGFIALQSRRLAFVWNRSLQYVKSVRSRERRKDSAE